MNSVEALNTAIATIDQAATNIRRSKAYAIGVSDSHQRLDMLHNARETLEALRDLIAEREVPA
jgi:hypothetical protein